MAEQAKELTLLRDLVTKLAAPHVPSASSKDPPNTRASEPTPSQQHVNHASIASVGLKKTPDAWKTRDSPDNPLLRNSHRRLIIDHPVPRKDRPPSQATLLAINSALKSITTTPNLRVICVLYSKLGRPIIIASESTPAKELVQHRSIILQTIIGKHQAVQAWVDGQQFRVKLNGVPTHDHDNKPISPVQICQHLIQTKQMEPSVLLAQPPEWIGATDKRAQKSHSSIVLPFLRQSDAIKFHHTRKYLVLGELCRTSVYTDQPPPKRKLSSHSDPAQRPSAQEKGTQVPAPSSRMKE